MWNLSSWHFEESCGLHAENVTQERFQDSLNVWAKVVAFVLPCFIGMLINGAILTVILWSRMFRTKAYLFLANMTVADLFLAAIYGAIQINKEGVFHTEHSNTLPVGTECQFQAYVEIAIQSVMILCQTAASFERKMFTHRFVIIVLPFQAQRFWTSRMSQSIVAICWVASLLIGFIGPIFVTSECISLTDTGGQRHVIYYCGVRHGYYLLVSKIRLVVLFLIPFTLMCIFYGSVCYILWRSYDKLHARQVNEMHEFVARFSLAETDERSTVVSLDRYSTLDRLLGSNNTGRLLPEGNRKHMYMNPQAVKSRRRVIKLLISILLVFMLCWAPKLILDIYNARNLESIHLEPELLFDKSYFSAADFELEDLISLELDFTEDQAHYLDHARVVAHSMLLYHPTFSALLILFSSQKLRSTLRLGRRTPSTN
ncbi:Cholecystokinin receptor [Trichinella pseudospiralis]|uniref:Cholecystokinin receptor n=1 Tax=Trichinella pseudospiralis TaxID=6337 RepID=A0A0V1FQY5_TRIPS|nr:Cholecystokinin receptor [Trichinella pseudospiralis]